MGIWSQVSNMAAQTPQERNRYVDFLRAVSILVVIGSSSSSVVTLTPIPWRAHGARMLLTLAGWPRG